VGGVGQVRGCEAQAREIEGAWLAAAGARESGGGRGSGSEGGTEEGRGLGGRGRRKGGRRRRFCPLCAPGRPAPDGIPGHTRGVP